MLARKLNRDEVTLEQGTVVNLKDGSWSVRVGGASYSAKRAKSCLVAPNPGDEVLLSFGRAGTCFILAVLEGDEAETNTVTKLEVDGDLELHVGSGQFAVKAARGVSLSSGNELNLVGKSLSVSALEGTIFVEKLEHLGSRFKAEVEAMRIVGTVCDSFFERVSQRVQRSYRTVEDIDQLKANKVDYAAETTLALRARHAVVQAEEICKVDAGQVQLG
ncbi:MAG TPA: DUF3540 domain-containing protein [Polyangium sp.]|nr:DUF3540 domain-containing protein [Polyangium sp.]